MPLMSAYEIGLSHSLLRIISLGRYRPCPYSNCMLTMYRSAIGPHPFPTIVRTFQSIIGEETKEQMQKLRGKLPDTIIACVGGGSNAAGMFAPFIKNPAVKLVGVEAGGEGLDSTRHAATLGGGTKGVLHGVKTYILQNE